MFCYSVDKCSACDPNCNDKGCDKQGPGKCDKGCKSGYILSREYKCLGMWTFFFGGVYNAENGIGTTYGRESG